jgi:hypothetical protein
VDCQNLASKVGSRCLGLALLGASCEFCHPAVDQKLLKKHYARSAALRTLAANKGCKSALRKWKMTRAFGGLAFDNKMKDPGFKAKLKGLRKEGGGSEQRVATFCADTFAVCQFLDSYLHGINDVPSTIQNIQRCASRWPYEAQSITAATTVWHGTLDTLPQFLAESVVKAIPGAKLELLQGDGHTTMLRCYRRILVDLVQGGATPQ